MHQARVKALLPHPDEQKPRADEKDSVERERQDMVDGTRSLAELNQKRDQYQRTKHVERSFRSQQGNLPSLLTRPILRAYAPVPKSERHA
jgi:hypothetical protein